MKNEMSTPTSSDGDTRRKLVTIFTNGRGVKRVFICPESGVSDAVVREVKQMYGVEECSIQFYGEISSKFNKVVGASSNLNLPGSVKSVSYIYLEPRGFPRSGTVYFYDYYDADGKTHEGYAPLGDPDDISGSKRHYVRWRRIRDLIHRNVIKRSVGESPDSLGRSVGKSPGSRGRSVGNNPDSRLPNSQQGVGPWLKLTIPSSDGKPVQPGQAFIDSVNSSYYTSIDNKATAISRVARQICYEFNAQLTTHTVTLFIGSDVVCVDFVESGIHVWMNGASVWISHDADFDKETADKLITTIPSNEEVTFTCYQQSDREIYGIVFVEYIKEIESPSPSSSAPSTSPEEP